MSDMTWTRKNIQKLAGIAATAAGMAVMLVFIAPSNPFIVAAFIGMAGAMGALIASLFLPYIYTYIIATAVVLFMGMTYITGFQILNTILLVCFIIGLSIIVRK